MGRSGAGARTVYLAAMRFEVAALLRRLEDARRVPGPGGSPAVVGRIGGADVVIAVSGVGARRARATADWCVRLAARDTCRQAVWIGVAGALSPDLAVGDLVAAESVVAEDGSTGLDLDADLAAQLATRGCVLGRLVTVPGLVVRAEEKAALWRRTGSVPLTAVDMETWEAARLFQAAGVRFAAVRAISDTAAENLPAVLEAAMRSDGRLNRSLIARRALLQPASWAALGRLRRAAAACAEPLAAAAASLA